MNYFIVVKIAWLVLMHWQPIFASHNSESRKLNLKLYSELTSEDIASMYKNFKSKYNKTYNSTEEILIRKQNFHNFLSIIDKRNVAAGAMVHDITQFADLSQQEFASAYLGLRTSIKTSADVAQPTASNLKKSTVLNNINADWRKSGYVTSVKDQGGCGCCWAFSSIGQVESDSARVFGKTYDLSAQQLIDCDNGGADQGCHGGNDVSAFSFIQSAGGLVNASYYSFISGSTGAAGICQSSIVTSHRIVTVQAYIAITGESNIAAYVSTTGPTTIYVDATTWSTYSSSSGVWTTTSCPASTILNHAVQIVGLVIPNSVQNCTNISGSCFWIVRNSWGPQWGHNGYIFLEYGANTCNMFGNSAYYVNPALVGFESPIPSLTPTDNKSVHPSIKPTKFPSSTTASFSKPTTRPFVPSCMPTTRPFVPSCMPTSKSVLTRQPTTKPLCAPSAHPSIHPSTKVQPQKSANLISTHLPLAQKSKPLYQHVLLRNR